MFYKFKQFERVASTALEFTPPWTVAVSYIKGLTKTRRRNALVWLTVELGLVGLGRQFSFIAGAIAMWGPFQPPGNDLPGPLFQEITRKQFSIR